MKSSTRSSTLTFPVFAYCLMTAGRTSVSNCWQNGHCRSMYSTIVTFARPEPSVMPFCGIPLKSASTSREPGSPAAIEPTFGTFFGVDEPPPVKTTISTTTTAITAATAPAPMSTRGEACRLRAVPFDWTGGGALCARRFSLLFLPLAIGRKTSRVVVRAGSGKRQERDEQDERGEREGRDRHVAELVGPLHRAADADLAALGRRDGVVLDEDVVDGDSRADERQRQEIARDAMVAGERGEERHDRERVHADALEPAELAGDEVRDLGEEETASRGDRRDDERGPELVAPKGRADRAQRASHPGRGGEPDEDEQACEHLADDAENRERDDRVMRHGESFAH